MREAHMKPDAHQFLAELAKAYNKRDRAALFSFFALDDPRFCMFEEFSGELLHAWNYAQILSTVGEATGSMSFEVLDSRRYGEYLLVHAIQRIEEQTGRRENEEAVIRVTLFVSMREGAPRILSGHFSSMMLCFPKRETVIRWSRMGEGA